MCTTETISIFFFIFTVEDLNNVEKNYICCIRISSIILDLWVYEYMQ